MTLNTITQQLSANKTPKTTHKGKKPWQKLVLQHIN